MRLFGYDGPLGRAARLLGELLILNVCFLLCCLPVFTFGAAVSALYGVFLNESCDSGVVKRFFGAFRENLRQATGIWLILLAVAVPLVGTLVLLALYEIPGSGLIRILLVILGALYLSVSAFVFPLQAHYENPVPRTLRNAAVLGVSLILHGVLMSLVNFLPVLVFFQNLGLFPTVLALWLGFGFSGSAKVNSLILKSVFNKLQPEES